MTLRFKPERHNCTIIDCIVSRFFFKTKVGLDLSLTCKQTESFNTIYKKSFIDNQYLKLLIER